MRRNIEKSLRRKRSAELAGTALLVSFISIWAWASLLAGAGGPEDANSQPICDPQTGSVVLPRQPARQAETAAPTRCPDSARFLLGGKLNINRAGKAELALLPRIGPKTADLIIEHRSLNGRYNSMEEVKSILELNESARASLDLWADVE